MLNLQVTAASARPFPPPLPPPIVPCRTPFPLSVVGGANAPRRRARGQGREGWLDGSPTLDDVQHPGATPCASSPRSLYTPCPLGAARRSQVGALCNHAFRHLHSGPPRSPLLPPVLRSCAFFFCIFSVPERARGSKRRCVRARGSGGGRRAAPLTSHVCADVRRICDSAIISRWSLLFWKRHAAGMVRGEEERRTFYHLCHLWPPSAPLPPAPLLPLCGGRAQSAAAARRRGRGRETAQRPPHLQLGRGGAPRVFRICAPSLSRVRGRC